MDANSPTGKPPTLPSANPSGRISIGELVQRDAAAAVRQLGAVIARDPRNAGAQRMLGKALRILGRPADAELAEAAAIRASVYDPQMQDIAHAMIHNDLSQAEALLRQRLVSQPTDVAAIRLMAELAARLGRLEDSERLLHRALELSPAFAVAKANLATVLYKQHRFAEAATQLEGLLLTDDGSPSDRNLLAAALGRIGNYDEALALYRELTESFPDHAKLWMSYGHVLKTVGKLAEGVAAYRHALTNQLDLGEVWWSLANLKTFAFTQDDVQAMEAALAAEPELEDRLHLHFALGKALADSGDVAASFEHYRQGNALRSQELSYDPARVSTQVDRVCEIMTPQFAASLEGHGDVSCDPIFILGLPRAGSTLIEQILASHSQIEGTMELPDIPAMAMREAKALGEGTYDWPGALANMEKTHLAQLGAEFLDRTRIQRKTDKPFFIDKLPNNWAYAGFIHAIFPNARIIDARRHPMDCCFSNFRQHFAKGQGFSYDLEHIGRYYADYVRVMDHYDAVLPGRIHRVIHEELLDEPEAVVRQLLEYLQLRFEDGCLEFYRNRRAVRTASSEQVRRPLNRDGVDQWVAYAQWLGPLEDALGDLPQTYTRNQTRAQ